MYTAHADRVIPTDISAAWQHFTRGERLTEWFADSGNIRRGEVLRFGFGDGDFFVGQVTGWAPPRELSWSWRFLGVGPTFEVHVGLAEADGGTRVTVTDTGATSSAEAESLTVGWIDFLERLDAYVRTGTRTRYLWSESIVAGAVLPRQLAALRDLIDASWMREHFQDATSEVTDVDGDVSVNFRDPAWDGVSTTARIHATPLAGGTYVGVTHSGWPALARGRGLGERRRYAGLWQRALTHLERACA